MQPNEETFIRTFIRRDVRDRWLTRLASTKTRTKQLNQLAHTFVQDLDPRFVFATDQIPRTVADQIQHVLSAWKQTHPSQLCSIIAVSSERDGHMMPFADIDTDPYLTFGAIILIIPDQLAYYYPERNNLSQQPGYVLFRP